MEADGPLEDSKGAYAQDTEVDGPVEGTAWVSGDHAQSEEPRMDQRW